MSLIPANGTVENVFAILTSLGRPTSDNAAGTWLESSRRALSNHVVGVVIGEEKNPLICVLPDGKKAFLCVPPRWARFCRFLR